MNFRKRFNRMMRTGRPPGTLLWAFVLAAGLLAAGCGGGGGSGTDVNVKWPMADVKPPGVAAGFAAAEDDGRVTLSWTNPGDTDFAGVVVRRGTAGYPADPRAADSTTETEIYRGKATSYTDTELADGTDYYYTAFTYDLRGNYAAGATASATAVFKPFTLVVVPDSQYYVTDDSPYKALLSTNFNWVVASAATENIKFVLHEGDITNNNTADQWERAKGAFDLLDGTVPYALALGNHDEIGDTTALFNTYFPLSKFEALPTFGGVYETGKMDNCYHTFYAGGVDWLIIVFSYSPWLAELEWASGVAAAHPHHRVIVVTHAYLKPDGTRSSIGDRVWENLVKLHAGMTFVFNGHYTDEPHGSLQVSTGDAGNKVYEMFADYQSLPLSGTGAIRVVRVDPRERKVGVKTYQPWPQTYMIEEYNQFELTDVDLSRP